MITCVTSLVYAVITFGFEDWQAGFITAVARSAISGMLPSIPDLSSDAKAKHVMPWHEAEVTAASRSEWWVQAVLVFFIVGVGV